MVMLDGHHWHLSDKLLRDKNRLEWAMEPLHMRYAFQTDGKPISPVQAVKLRKVPSIFTVIVRREAKLADTTPSTLRYEQ